MIVYRDGWKEVQEMSDRAEPQEVRCKVPVLKCDGCGREDVRLWNFLGDQLCEECLLDAAKEYEGEVVL